MSCYLFHCSTLMATYQMSDLSAARVMTPDLTDFCLLLLSSKPEALQGRNRPDSTCGITLNICRT